MTQLATEAPADCPLCPRLVAYREANSVAEPDWFNGAVPSFLPDGGEEDVRLLIIGLAPGRGGANRTGRPFTGDWAGDLLYATLIKFGLASGAYDKRPDDGLTLHKVAITNAVRCVPPENKPVAAEINACKPFLKGRIEALLNLKAILCLGKVSHDATLRTLGHRLAVSPFGHDTAYELEGPNGLLRVRSSYHCSRYNTNTGRLTDEMFETVVGACAEDIA
ncbi:MAG: uracil-DNA glycosylase [Pseudomonadota bacterium]